MTKRLCITIAAALALAAPAFAARAETTGEGPSPEATNPAPARELNQTDEQKAMTPGKDTGPRTAPSGSSEPARSGDDAAGQSKSESGASGVTPPAKPKREP
jgi:hypothetical protein